MNTTWTEERRNALKILAECSKVYEVTGDFTRDWTLGINKMKEQFPEEWKLLKGISMKMLHYAWKKYRKACYGICIAQNCTNKVVLGEVCCEEHYKISAYHRGTYSSPCIKNNMELIPDIVSKQPQRVLAEIVTKNILKLGYDDKKKLLGSEFEKKIIEKEQKRKKE